MRHNGVLRANFHQQLGLLDGKKCADSDDRSHVTTRNDTSRADEVQFQHIEDCIRPTGNQTSFVRVCRTYIAPTFSRRCDSS